MNFTLEPFNRNVADEELVRDLLAAAAKLKIVGKNLTFRSYSETGTYSPHTIVERFGSWNEGLRKAGLTLSMERDIPIEALFDNLKVVWIAKGKQPVSRDMRDAPSQYSHSVYADRFGGWRKALELFVAQVDQDEIEVAKDQADVKRQAPVKRTKRDPSLKLKFLVMKRDCFRCVVCGRSPSTVLGLILEIDHTYPWSKGGETVIENLRTLCFDCNRGKGAI